MNKHRKDVLITESENDLAEKPKRHSISEWHRELEAVLMTLEDCQVDCDGMTWAVSHLLKEAGVKHRTMYGFVRNEHNNDVVTPHFWVTLDDGWVVDLRLRMWLGDQDNIPHGVFHPHNEPFFFYWGEVVQNINNTGLTRQILDIMTDGKLSQMKVPER